MQDLLNVLTALPYPGGRLDYQTAVMDCLLANLDAFRANRRDLMAQVANIKRH